MTYKTEASIARNIKILIRFIRRLVSKKRIWYDAITFKEERYRVCGVSPFFVLDEPCMDLRLCIG